VGQPVEVRVFSTAPIKSVVYWFKNKNGGSAAFFIA
jgi:hypothetical protein